MVSQSPLPRSPKVHLTCPADALNLSNASPDSLASLSRCLQFDEYPHSLLESLPTGWLLLLQRSLGAGVPAHLHVVCPSSTSKAEKTTAAPWNFISRPGWRRGGRRSPGPAQAALVPVAASRCHFTLGCWRLRRVLGRSVSIDSVKLQRIARIDSWDGHATLS